MEHLGQSESDKRVKVDFTKEGWNILVENELVAKLEPAELEWELNPKRKLLWEVVPQPGFVYREHNRILIEQLEDGTYKVGKSSYYCPRSLIEAIRWTLDNYTYSTQREEIDRLDKKEAEILAEIERGNKLRAFETSVKYIPRHTSFFVNQAERGAELLGVIIDTENLAYQALYEYEMPNGTTALTFLERGNSPKFQKGNPNYYTLSKAWLELLAEEELVWTGNSQGVGPAPQPRVILEAKKELGKAANAYKICSFADKQAKLAGKR